MRTSDLFSVVGLADTSAEAAEDGRADTEGVSEAAFTPSAGHCNSDPVPTEKVAPGANATRKAEHVNSARCPRATTAGTRPRWVIRSPFVSWSQGRRADLPGTQMASRGDCGDWATVTRANFLEAGDTVHKHN
jgi:hypothetical protein